VASGAARAGDAASVTQTPPDNMPMSCICCGGDRVKTGYNLKDYGLWALGYPRADAQKASGGDRRFLKPPQRGVPWQVLVFREKST